MRALRWIASAILTLLLVGCSSAQNALMPDVVGKRLDVALSDIKRAGFSGDPEIVGGGVFGVLEKSNWQVCEQLPLAGQPMQEKPRLTVDRACGSASAGTADESATNPESTPTTGVEESGDADDSADTDESADNDDSTVTAKQIENHLKSAFGLKPSKSWTSLCGNGSDMYPFPCAISKITFESDVVKVRIQDNFGESEAEKYARATLSLICQGDDLSDFEDVSWVEVSDATGTHLGQQSAADNAFCQQNR
jgi:hypothetical protein